jgi:DNA-binding transcriptional LysR family regulator
VNSLLDGNVDVAIAGARIENEDKFHHTHLYEEKMVVACGLDDPIANRKSIGLRDVGDQPYLDRLQCEFRDLFLSEMHKLGFDPNFYARSDREEWIQTLIQKGSGVSILPDRSITLPGIKKLELENPKLRRSVFAIVALGRYDNALIKSFMSGLSKHPWSG